MLSMECLFILQLSRVSGALGWLFAILFLIPGYVQEADGTSVTLEKPRAQIRSLSLALEALRLKFKP